MKCKLLLLLFMLAGSISLSQVPSPQNITFQWTYTTNVWDTNLVFKIYSSTSAQQPKPWELLYTVPGTQRNLTVSVMPGERYYYIAGSNFWGEANPSNVSGTPPAPQTSTLTLVELQNLTMTWTGPSGWNTNGITFNVRERQDSTDLDQMSWPIRTNVNALAAFLSADPTRYICVMATNRITGQEGNLGNLLVTNVHGVFKR